MIIHRQVNLLGIRVSTRFDCLDFLRRPLSLLDVFSSDITLQCRSSADVSAPWKLAARIADGQRKLRFPEEEVSHALRLFGRHRRVADFLSPKSSLHWTIHSASLVFYVATFCHDIFLMSLFIYIYIY